MYKVKTLKRVIISIILVLFTSVSVLGLTSCKTSAEVGTTVEGSDMLFPSVDFIQNWLALSYSDEDWDTYFGYMSDAGFDSVILQSIVSREEGGTIIYFEDDGAFGDVDRTYSYTLGRLMDAADRNGFKVYVGTADCYKWWWPFNYAKEDYRDGLAEAHGIIFDKVCKNYGDHECFAGWYYTPEMFTNIFDFESDWILLLNDVIDRLNACPKGDLPLMISPFYNSLSSLALSDHSTYADILEGVNFRPGDIFAPQDSFGFESKDYQDYLDKIYDYEKTCYEAAQKAGLQLWINIEIFTKKGSYDVATQERMVQQFKMANLFSDKAVCFSFSHYINPLGTSANNENSGMYSAYLDMRNA